MLMTLLATTALISCGITAPRGNHGYANLDSPGMLDTNRTTSLSIGPTLLRFAANHMDDDPKTKALLKSLDGVRIRIYEVNGDNQKVLSNLERMGQKLQDDDWAPVMLMNEDGERTQMFAKSSSSGIQGLTIVSADDNEVVVINVMGDIEPEHFKDVMVALDVDDAPETQVVSVN
jgi:hypothetical protein